MGSNYLIGEFCSFAKGASIPRDRMFDCGPWKYLHYGDLYKGHNLYIDIEKPTKAIPFISDDERIKSDQFVSDGDIIYVLTSETIDDLGKALMVKGGEGEEIVAGTETTVMRIENCDVANPAYINYMLQTELFKRKLRQYVTGMKVFRVHPRDIAKIEVNLPDIDTQNKVVHILDAIYEKCSNINRLNDYLAEMADALFADAFGDLEDNAVLSDIANITMGQSPAGTSYNEEGVGTVFYQGRGEFGWRYPTQRLFTTEPKRMAKAGDVLMSVRAPVGDLNLAYEDCCIGRGLAAISCDYPSYCLYLMRSLSKKLDAYNGEGTVFGSINGKALKGLEIALPGIDDIATFEAMVAPIDAQIRCNETESRSLSQLRDALLPKLMSGEIDVSKVDLTQLNNHLV